MSIISDILVFSMTNYYSKIYTYIILFNFHNYSMDLLLLLCINSGFSMNWLTQLWRRQNQHLQSGPELLLEFKFTMCGLLQNSLSLQGSLFFFFSIQAFSCLHEAHQHYRMQSSELKVY